MINTRAGICCDSEAGRILLLVWLLDQDGGHPLPLLPPPARVPHVPRHLLLLLAVPWILLLLLLIMWLGTDLGPVPRRHYAECDQLRILSSGSGQTKDQSKVQTKGITNCVLLRPDRLQLLHRLLPQQDVEAPGGHPGVQVEGGHQHADQSQMSSWSPPITAHLKAATASSRSLSSSTVSSCPRSCSRVPRNCSASWPRSSSSGSWLLIVIQVTLASGSAREYDLQHAH